MNVDETCILEHPQVPGGCWPSAGKTTRYIASGHRPAPRIQNNQNVPSRFACESFKNNFKVFKLLHTLGFAHFAALITVSNI
jgi:hypothetical protein